MSDPSIDSRTRAFFSWVGRHVGILAAVIIVASVGLGMGGVMIRSADDNPESPRFDPGGEIYDTFE
ncbi:MAG: hypothetical protein GY926_26385, partial [bacterium]|nr:hypothetical protein [bacterium]